MLQFYDGSYFCIKFISFFRKNEENFGAEIINVHDFLLSEEKKANPHFIGIRGEGKVVFNFILFKISSPLTSRALLIKIYAFVSFQNHQQKKKYMKIIYVCFCLNGMFFL